MTWLWPYPVNWGDRVTNAQSYQTTIFESEDGTEQRSALRSTPRRTIQFGSVIAGGELAKFDRLIRRHHAEPCGLIDYNRSTGLTSNFVSGSDTAHVEQPKAWLYRGAAVAVVDGDRREVRTVKSVYGLAVVFHEENSSTWPAGTMIHPLTTGMIKPEFDIDLHTTKTGEVRFELEVTPGSEPWLREPMNRADTLWIGLDMGFNAISPMIAYGGLPLDLRLVLFGQTLKIFNFPSANRADFDKIISMIRKSSGSDFGPEDVDVGVGVGRRFDLVAGHLANVIPPLLEDPAYDRRVFGFFATGGATGGSQITASLIMDGLRDDPLLEMRAFNVGTAGNSNVAIFSNDPSGVVTFDHKHTRDIADALYSMAIPATGGEGRVSLTLMIDLSELSRTPYLETFNNRPVWSPRINWRRGRTITYARPYEVVGEAHGVIEVMDKIPYDSLTLEGELVAKTAVEAAQIERFFRLMRGRRGEFYMTQPNDELRAFGNHTAMSAILPLVGRYAAEEFLNSRFKRAVKVSRTDGIYFYRQIIGAALDGDGNSLLTMDGVWGSNVQQSMIEKVEWLVPYRFATDRLSTTWHTNEVAEMKVSMTEIPANTSEIFAT